MYAEWPASVMQHWATEFDAAGQLLFRGPRCATELGGSREGGLPGKGGS